MTNFAQINASKANFETVYTRADPRAYYAALGSLDYRIPDLAAPVLRQLLAALPDPSPSGTTVLDVGCSYGINAAVHRLPVTFAALSQRYAGQHRSSPQDVERMDLHYYGADSSVPRARFIGLDVSAPAVRYAQTVGLIEHGLVADLEKADVPQEDIAALRDVRVLFSTGCIGYVTDRTYRRLLTVIPQVPWVVSFVLRMFPYEPFANMLSEHGLTTERLPGVTFAQRRFRDEQERMRTLQVLHRLGLQTGGLEAEGRLYAELYVSRPAAEVRARPLASLVRVQEGGRRSAISLEHQQI